jgi:hypothetical protein
LQPPGVLESLRSNWRILKSGRPGSRFQDLRRHRRRQKGGGSKASRVFLIGLGIVLVLLGPVAGLVPGPGGIVVFGAGAALLASESMLVARFLDWCEPRLRRMWSRVRKIWSRTPVIGRIGVCVGVAAVFATLIVTYFRSTS